jgi:hypothetical protein
MNDMPRQLTEEHPPPLQHEDSAAKLLLLQQHAAYLAKLDRVTFTNRALCLFALVGGGLLLAFLNVESACIAYLGVIALAGLWRVEMSLLRFRLKTLEEQVARSGGGSWEDLYIRLKNESAGEPFDRWLLWSEPVLWFGVAVLLIVANGASLISALKRWGA